jgi:hypothetical protein
MTFQIYKLWSYRSYLLISLLLLTYFSCGKQQENILLIDNNDPDEIINSNKFSVNENFILKNNMVFKVKGVVYVPGYPGYLPWEIEQSTSLPANLKQSIDTDINNIKAMGANTVRFWGAPKYCYQALKNTGDLYFLQTIWIDGEQPDFQDSVFKEIVKDYIRAIIDRIYSVYTNNNPPLIAYLVGNELSNTSINSTNAAHPEITSYSGIYISTSSNVSATEAFIAEMADYVKTYEFTRYKNLSLVSYSNDIRTADIIDTPFLDFRSHNAYSYAVPYYRPSTQLGSYSQTLFQGWIEEIKSKYLNVPLLITETGLSISPNATRIGSPNYGYGGNTVVDQMNGILQNINDINTSNLPIAGVCIHEYLDAWWKFGLEDSFSQDPNDIEEWFGIVGLKKNGSWYTTEFRNVYFGIQQTWVD